MPYAPGTFGSAAAFLFIFLLQPTDQSLFVILIVIFLIGLFASHNTEKQLGKDSGHIVIDEFCGYLISVILIPKTTGFLLAGFILFRIFDILKPPPIGKIENITEGGAGVMLDDVMAGIYTNISLQIWVFLF